MWWNPMLHAEAQVRTGFYPTYRGDFVMLTYGYGVSLAPIALGLLLVRRHHRDILEE
jgi:capsular polysaccharide transport system permease protein